MKYFSALLKLTFFAFACLVTYISLTSHTQILTPVVLVLMTTTGLLFVPGNALAISPAMVRVGALASLIFMLVSLVAVGIAFLPKLDNNLWQIDFGALIIFSLLSGISIGFSSLPVRFD